MDNREIEEILAHLLLDIADIYEKIITLEQTLIKTNKIISNNMDILGKK